MKFTGKDIFWLFVLGIVCFFFLTRQKEEEKDNVIVKTVIKEVFTKGKTDTIYISKPKPYRVTEYVIDSTLIDSIGELNYLLDLAKIREYKEVYTDSLITFNIYSKVIGKLDSISVAYDLKPQKVTYIETNTTIEKTPKFAMWFGAGVQTNLNQTYFPLELSWQTKKGNLWDVGYSINPLDIKQSLFGATYKTRLFW